MSANVLIGYLKSAVLALFLLAAQAAAASAADIQPYFDRQPLSIAVSGGKTYTFTVEMAVSASQREHGLMFRKAMDADAGMLFDFGQSRNVLMWMKNTDLALDMLFIGSDGTIRHIQENAVPYSETVIDSNGAVKFVLELNAGTVAALGIKKGDTVVNRRIGNAQ